jgi:sugar phosphate isomerase/epimerase
LTAGLTRAGIGTQGSLKDFVSLAARHGFGAVDSNGGEVEAWVSLDGLAAVQNHLKASGVRLGCFSLPLDWSHGEAEFRAGLATVARHAEVAASVGCGRFMTWAMPSTPEPAARYTAVTTRRLRLAARLLAGFGLKLGIEYIGPHHLRRREPNPFLWDLPGALEWLDAIGEPNAGVVLDSFHWHTSEGTLDEIRALDPARIVHVHLNDAAPGPVSALLDNDRLFPGEGCLPLADFLIAVAGTGYRGIVAQEVLTPQPPTESPEELAQRAEKNFRRLFAAAGIGA